MKQYTFISLCLGVIIGLSSNNYNLREKNRISDLEYQSLHYQLLKSAYESIRDLRLKEIEIMGVQKEYVRLADEYLRETK